MGNKMWGGRFADGPDAIMEAINVSIDFDQRLAMQDLAGSRAHAQMLSDCGIISSTDVAEILKGLDQVEQEIVNDTFPFRRDLEDIHMNIEARLTEIVGPAAGRLHTARSRNDQVATDFKLHVRERLEAFDEGLKQLQIALVNQAAANADTVMPGFTHLQTAQPVTFGHHCLAYVEMLARDRSRFMDAHARAGQSPLGSAALAGTSFPINREQTAKALGFDEPTRNSLDAVADRDFVLETLSAASICSIHLSRLAEEIVIWTSAQFNFVRLPDKFSTGSSIMPQKRNPDAAELVRAKPGRIIGALTSLLVMLKGLPMTYSKDMQEDKEPAFDGMDALDLAIAAMTGMMADLTVNKPAMRDSAGKGFSTATDLADWLVRALDMPFRDAHHVTGRLVAAAEAKGCDLDGLTLEEMQKTESRITPEVFEVLGLDNSVKSRTSFGGTSPDNVRAQVAFWREQLS